ncbi:uncharacterized protein GGS22DRAFT_162815 [Annulohypoxylon maeteangense]|uniref:uncharacterized protein n=1 Tax=Annulohypoxylon maeteangense TaxID=1927788 RepID=UPI0020087276|nr:uncharacterized protein GGS22DRAFT_162815 [Annulohypoxylon maeteangense]KAI0885120.1 hypothetical protein GGS22DRAFT_162815 [Annulohypoxylon maeteangense]
MADQQRVSTPIGSRSAVRRSYLRTSSQSPSRHQQRLGDDLLSQLSPNAAVDALRSPTGALKACMDKASASEQAFAMRTAIASKKIRDWLEELSNWTWHRSNGATGFEMPPAKKRKLFEPEQRGGGSGKSTESNLPYDTDYLGSLRVADVDRYEKRVEKIQQELDDLDLEEIKSQVLHNHILPLSRPSSPAFSDGGCSVMSTSMFAKMEDLTAVVTAITVQALPNLSRLTRLLNTWTTRFLILRKVPSLMVMIADAEVALRSGWNAIESPESSPTRATGRDNSSNLSRKEFDIIKRVIQQKVTKPGRALDYMLDSLEGSMDTLPDEWLDKMEQIERGYAIWETTAERKVLAGERNDQLEVSSKDVSIRTEPETPRPQIHVEGPSPTKDSPEPSDFDQFASPPTPSNPPTEPRRTEDMDNSPELPKGRPAASSKPTAVKFLANGPRKDTPASTSQVVDPSTVAAHQRDTNPRAKAQNPFNYDGASEKRPVAVKKTISKSITVLSDFPRLSRPSKQSRVQTHDKSESRQTSESPRTSPVLGEVDRNIIRSPPLELKRREETAEREPVYVDELESSILEPSVLEPVDEEGEGEELELPPARFVSHRTSNQSIASTVIHGTSNSFLGNSDSVLFREGSMEPDLPRLADPDEPFSSDNISPPSSPPLRYKARSTSVTFKDVPEIASLPDPNLELGSSPPRSPLEPPEVFDADASFEYESQAGSPSRMSTVSSISEDEHLHQQISDILESIPAKIRIKRTPGVNLNPPDLQLPSRPKSRASDFARRSNSSLSARSGTSFSRSGTPSFMLAPARDSRAKTKSSQGIRVYHLSRSTGEPPLKLLIRCVGEKGERVMVRIGGGWADLGEYLREYAVHHSSRSKGEGKVDIRDLPTVPSGLGSSPSSRPGSAMESPSTPLMVRKTRKSLGEEGGTKRPKTPFSIEQGADSPSSQTSARSRSSSRVDWDEEDSSLGLAGPKGRKVDMSDESRAWIESVKEKVRIASGDRVPPPEQRLDTKFGEMGKVGGTKRLFKRN